MSPVPQASASRETGSFRRAVQNTGWLTFARLSGDLAGVLLFVMISRHLGLEAIGEYSHAFAVASIAAAIIGLGLDEFGLREYSRLDPRQRGWLLPSIVGLQTALLLAVVLAAFIYIVLSDIPARDATVIALVVIHVLAFRFALVLFIPSFATQRMRVPALAELVFRVGGLLAAVILVSVLQTALLATLVPLAVGTVALLLLAAGLYRRETGQLSAFVEWQAFKRILTAAWSIAAYAIIYNIYTRTSIVMLAAMRGPAETGVYATAFKLYEFGLMPLYLLGIAVFPTLSRSFENSSDEFAATADKFLRMSLVYAAVLSWGLLFVAPILVPLVLGSEFQTAIPATRLMAVAAMLAAIDLACLRLMVGMQLQHIRLKIQIVATIVMVSLNIVLIPSHGPIGAIVATVGAQATLITWYFVIFARHEKTARLVRTIGRFALILAITLALGIVGYQIGLPVWLSALSTLGVFLGLVAGFRFGPNLDFLQRARKPAAMPKDGT